MGQTGLSKIIRDFKGTLIKYSPEILTGLGIAGMVTTVVMAIRATPKAMEKIEAAEVEKRMRFEQDGKNTDGKLTKKEVIQATWKCYIPTAITGFLSIGCIIAAQSVSVRRRAALVTAYTLSEAAMREYQAKVIEAIGEKKEQGIRDSIDKDKVDKNPTKNSEIIITQKGNTLCFDPLSGRYFQSDIDIIRRAEIEMNRRLIHEIYVSLNDFYYEIGLKGTKIGSELGWNIDRGYVELNFSSQLTDDGRPCLVINYNLSPKSDFMQ